MTHNNDNNQRPTYNEPQYNRDYYSQNGQNYQQNDYVPQSYGMTNRYDDLYDYEDESSSKDFIIGALVGGIIGAATALFLAPKSGKELRSDLNTHATTLKEKTATYTDTAKEKSGGLTQQVKDQSSKVVDKVKNLKGGQSPMDDGTASSEGEESIEMLDTVQNSVDKAESSGKEAFTSTANALREAVEEVKEEKKSESSNSSNNNNSSSNKSNNNSTNSSNKNNNSNSNNSSNKNNNKSSN
ncbi:YtxH domain-containing protein [Planococcus ruber]|uniref:YtxH domain-containing protein n=1 Tax=Planococcus ruber TaxID=2027871 RepID=UPI001FED339C|nr:YtxH domain-containing protein [Planococcus ruber]MCJ1908538.1 YtxH domain-containing protein [Planococcus ruber]